MVFTKEQELDIARQRIANNTASDIDRQNVAFADQQTQAPQQAPQTYHDFINKYFDDPALMDAREKLQDMQTLEPGYLQREAARLRGEDPYIQTILNNRQRIESNLGATGELYEKYSDIFDPIKRNALISREISNLTAGLSRQNLALEQRGGTLDQQAQLAAEAFTQQLGIAEDRIDELKDTLLSFADADYAELLRQRERMESLEDFQTKLAMEAQYATSPGGGGGGDEILNLDSMNDSQMEIAASYADLVSQGIWTVAQIPKEYKDVVAMMLATPAVEEMEDVMQLEPVDIKGPVEYFTDPKSPGRHLMSSTFETLNPFSPEFISKKLGKSLANFYKK